MNTLVCRILMLPLCAALLLSVPTVVQARPRVAQTSAPSVADKATAKRSYSTAQRLFDVGRFREALAHYQKAFDAVPLPAFLFNIAQCHRNLEQFARAIFTLRRYLRLAPKADNRGQVEALILELQREKKKADEKSRRRRLSVVPTPAPTPRRARPVYKKWWFWTGLAAGAVAGTLIVVGTSSNGGSLPSSDLGNVDFDR